MLPIGPYLIQEFRHIVDVVVNDEPDALVAVVGGHLGQRVLLVLGHVWRVFWVRRAGWRGLLMWRLCGSNDD